MDHNRQRKIALMTDFTGFGRCSVTVQLPVISKLKIQCVPVPTAVFSNHPGFPEHRHWDFTDHMDTYLSMWEDLGLRFEGICIGYLNSTLQIEMAEKLIQNFKAKDNVVIVDPVMGDHGKLYSTVDQAMTLKMKELVGKADIITPNLTEACILTDTPYKEKWKETELRQIGQKLLSLGVSKVVITGIPQKSFLCNMCVDGSGSEILFRMVKTIRIGTSRSGTGDLFAAIVAADAVNGVDFVDSVKRASGFVKKCILKAIEMDLPITDGVPFEEVLDTLKAGKRNDS